MATFCCEMMTVQMTFSCDQHPDPCECPDKLVDYVPKVNEYGLLIHDGGSSRIVIRYCPWCGSDLGPSQSDAWFDELEARGLKFGRDELPPELTDARWWQARCPASQA